MSTLDEALCRTAARFRGAGLESPRLDAEVLLCEAAGMDRATLFAHPDLPLADSAAARLDAWVERRLRAEPVAYLVGHREFYGLDLVVDRRVLIPRPETEHLVEEALAWCRARKPLGAGLAIADVGTGSGAIAVALAVHLPEAIVYAIDASSGALDVAAANCRRHGVDARVHLLQGDLLVPLPQPIHLIAANLPYISDEDWAHLAPGVREYEPEQALRGGPDGLDAIRALLLQAPARLRPGGAVMLEIGAARGAVVSALVREALPGARVRVVQDLAGLERVVVGEMGGV